MIGRLVSAYLVTDGSILPKPGRSDSYLRRSFMNAGLPTLSKLARCSAIANTRSVTCLNSGPHHCTIPFNNLCQQQQLSEKHLARQGDVADCHNNSQSSSTFNCTIFAVQRVQYAAAYVKIVSHRQTALGCNMVTVRYVPKCAAAQRNCLR